MRIGIYGAGDFCESIDRSIPYIAVDGGYDHLLTLGITPSFVIGDFDSARSLHPTCQSIVLPTKKDITDTEAAIQLAKCQGYQEISLYGVCGQRLDHFIAVLRLLSKYQDLSITIYDDLNKLFLVDGKMSIKKEDYFYLSFFSIEPTLISIEGVAYPLKDYVLTYKDALCVSNEILDDEAIVSVDHPTLCVQSRRIQ